MKISKPIYHRLWAMGLLCLAGLIFIQISKHYGTGFAAIFFFTITGLSLFNILIRKYDWSESFLSSKWNFYTLKFQKRLIVDLPIGIAFGKFEEVILSSGFKVVKSDDKKFKINALSKYNLYSGGENLYVQFEEKQNITRMIFSSISFRIHDFNKNDENLQTLLSNFEDSLTI